MKYLIYGHRSVTPLIVILMRLIVWTVRRLGIPGFSRWAVRIGWRRIVTWIAVVVALVAQAVMLYTLSQLVELCISLMEVWVELAAKHLEITLDAN